MTNQPFLDLSGKRALITGAGGLLGVEHGVALARCGASVILSDIHDVGLNGAREKILRQVPDADILLVQLDICDEAALVRLLDHLSGDGKQVDILINNASINPKMNSRGTEISGSVENYSMSGLHQEIQVGIVGTFLCCKVFGSQMAKRGYGVIINVASDLALLAPDQRVYAPTGKIEDVQNFKPIGYSIVKSAMLGLNRYLATYWAHKGVRVNCLLPGGVLNNQPEYLVNQVKERIPMGRWARPSEYQGAIAFLASESSAYMSGQTLVMDGGRSAW